MANWQPVTYWSSTLCINESLKSISMRISARPSPSRQCGWKRSAELDPAGGWNQGPDLWMPAHMKVFSLTHLSLSLSLYIEIFMRDRDSGLQEFKQWRDLLPTCLDTAEYIQIKNLLVRRHLSNIKEYQCLFFIHTIKPEALLCFCSFSHSPFLVWVIWYRGPVNMDTLCI